MSYRRGEKRPEHAYVGRRHRHVSGRGRRGKVTTYNHRDRSHEPQKEIRTDRTDNHYEGLVPTTYPCPQSSSRLVQVPAMTPSPSAASLTLHCVSHHVSAPHPCAPTSTSIPSALHQFPSLFSATTPPCHVPASASLHRSPQTRAEGFFL